jgi:uncharacterized membrane protein
MSAEPNLPGRKGSGRIHAIDVARGLALLAMASYHFTWDLEFFGYASPGLTAFGGWKFYARCIASTFLFLVGVSLVLAHGRGIRWRSFWKRLAMVAAAAAAISIVTRFATPDTFIFFGILHEIALASLLGLTFLRLPGLLTLVVAALVVAAPHYLRSPIFDHPALWWLGLSTVDPRSNDYVPLFPWFGAVLAGIGVTRIAVSSGLMERVRQLSVHSRLKPLVLAGQHSLAFYLIHQPVLIACVWLFSQVVPAPVLSPQESFLSSCTASCQQSRDAAFCPRYCGCMLGELKDNAMLERLFKGDHDAAFRQQVADLAGTCTVRTDEAMEEEKP